MAPALRLLTPIIALLAAAVQAQPYPARPVTLYVGFPAGSAIDTSARVMGQRLAEAFSQQFVIVNRDGAAATLAAGTVARAKPDGYTLLWGSSSPLASTPAINRNLPYDPRRDFAPVSIYFYIPYVIVTHPSVPAHDLQSLIALAKARPGKLNYGSTGVGGSLHFAIELILDMSGTQMTHVPYRGTPPMTVDLLAGQIDLATSGPATVAPHIQSGRLRAIAVTSRQRIAQLPQVATVDEAGLPGYEITGWTGMLAPAGTPAEIVAELSRQFVRALEHPAVKANIAAEGALQGGNTPDEFAAFIRREFDKYSKLAKRIQLAPEP